jgi:hypothetical protein
MYVCTYIHTYLYNIHTYPCLKHIRLYPVLKDNHDKKSYYSVDDSYLFTKINKHINQSY